MSRSRSALAALVLLTSGLVAWLLRPGSPLRDNAASLSERSPEERTALLEQSLRAVEDGLRHAPRDRWDVAYVVAAVGRDADSLRRWVHENTAWIPYRGTLRGPVGVLMDRQGNSLDRAMLLAALLTEAGHETRLARTELEAERAEGLLPDLVARRANLALDEVVTHGSGVATVRESAAEYQLDVADIERVVDGYETGTARLLSDLERRVPDQATRLISSIAAPDAHAEWLTRRDSALATLRDYWWVQTRSGESWLDLELSDSIGP